MEFGSKEWFEKLEENIKFPATIAFYVSNTGRQYSVTVDTKAEIDNIRFSKIRPPKLTSNEYTSLARIDKVEDSQGYYEISKRLDEIWKTD